LLFPMTNKVLGVKELQELAQKFVEVEERIGKETHSRMDGSIDWLNESNARIPKGEDFGFGPIEKDIRLAHNSTEAYDCGFVQMKYCAIKDV